MTDLLLWNSVSPRKRSLSDTFLENGIGILVKNCRNAGFNVVVEDWATEKFYKSILPSPVSRINRKLYKILLSNKGHNNKILFRITGFTAIQFQRLIDIFLNMKMHTRLNRLAKRIAAENIRVLGVKAWYGDAFKWSNQLVRKVNKLSPETLTIAGGAHPTIYREEFLKNSNFDIAVVSEGEKTLVDILKAARNKGTKREILAVIKLAVEQGEITNLLLKKDDEVVKTAVRKLDISTKETPKYNKSDSKVNIHVIIDSLGCSYGKCNFCVHGKIYNYHSRRPEIVVDEIKHMIGKGIGIFRFAGSGPRLTDSLKIAEKIIGNGLIIQYSMFGLAVRNANDPERFSKLVKSYETMIDSGLKAIFFGAESGNDTILREVLGKYKTSEDLVYTIKAVREASRITGRHVDVGLSFIHPVPTLGIADNESIFNDNLDLAKAINPDSIMCSPPAPFKGTDWYENAGDYGFFFGQDFIKDMLEYEYVLYKPLSMWKNMDVSLEDVPGLKLLEQCGEMRQGFEKAGFTTELTDEHFLLLRNTGYITNEAVEAFKKETLLDIISGNHDFTNSIYIKINRISRQIAGINKLRTTKTQPAANKYIIDKETVLSGI